MPLHSIRAALGLKPLKEGPPLRAAGRSDEPIGPEAAAAAAVAAKAAADAKAAALAERVASARERRAATEALRAQGTLGDASADVDDAWAWVNKSRTLNSKQAQAAAASVSARYDEQDEAATKTGGGRGEYTGADLAGMRVHALGAEDLAEGETLVLTLKDRRILDDGGDDDDEGGGLDQLENVRLVELRKREAARKAASKGKASGFDDDGDVAMTLDGGSGPSGAGAPKPGLLPKYDDVSDAAGLVLGGALTGSAPAGGPASDDAAAARAAAVKAKLAAAAAALGGAARTGLQSDFYSAEEMAAAKAPSAPVDPAAAGAAPPVKKLRKKQKPGRGAETRRVHADELIPMEELAGPGGDDVTRGGGDKQRATLDEEAAVAWERFQAAKAKAAAASAQRIGSRVAVAPPAAAETGGGGGGGDDESDRRLNAALERSRRVAAGEGPLGGERSVAALAASIARDAAAGGDAAGGGGGNWLEATAEFVRSISVDKAAKRAQEHGAAEPLDGIVGAPLIQAAPEGDGGDGGAGAPSHGGGGSTKRRQYRRPGAALEAADMDMDGDDVAGAPPGGAAAAEPSALLAPVPEPSALGGGGAKGLGATLAMLKATGSLGEGVTWAGRNTDKKGEAVRVATEAAGIATRDAAWQFDFKLDRFDEFGRKMTPKEAFRELCHRFHGIFPSKSKQEARLKQWHEEQKQLKARDNDTPLSSAEHMRAATQRTATPFVVLSGSVKSSQVSDARGHYAVAADEQLLGLQQQQQQGGQAPGGGDTRGAILQDTGLSAAALAGQPPPLEGAAKVRFMLNIPPSAGAGVKRPGGGQDGGAAKRQRTDE